MISRNDLLLHIKKRGLNKTVHNTGCLIFIAIGWDGNYLQSIKIMESVPSMRNLRLLKTINEVPTPVD